MHGKKYALFAMIAFAGACGGGDEAADDAAATDSAAQPTAEAPAPAAPANLPEGVTAEMVAQGQQIFTGKGNCFTCHGMDAKGTSLAPNLTDNEWLNIPGSSDKTTLITEVSQVVHTGVPQPKQFPAPMPAMGGAQLSEDEMKAVASYVATLQG